ncbi:MAG TPA: signal peptide peptidase SppA [Candidatus Dormibacteraeota bacterium]|nr:signal peptide peptidase SppA [Candidatus Dormibacteraeota bacterium]
MLLFPFRYLWWLISSIRRSIGTPPGFVLFVLENDLPALPDPPRPLWQRFTSRPRLSLSELGKRFDAIGRDPRIKGVVLHLRPVAMPMATLQDLRELVAKLRKSGKRVVAWAPFYSTGTYYMACACDEILLMPAGAIQPLGFANTGMFLSDGLARFGIEADFVQISPYKSAADLLTKSKMSEELREQVTWLLDSQNKEFLSGIAEGRLRDEKGAQELVDGSPYGDDTALESHVVDALVSEEGLAERLGQGAGAPVAIGTWERARTRMRSAAPTLGRGKYVAVLRIEGTIIDGRSGGLPIKPPIEVPLVGDNRAGDLSVVQAARQVAVDKRAAAVVLYVNSRGGSATASEAMRQALNAIAARKPLVVAMGPVAGSGGYWVSTPASWIVARPGSLTGSIGVLTGKIVTGGMWSKLMFNRETIAFGRHATIENDEKPYTDEERQIVKGQIDRIYKRFLEIVAKAREMTPEEVHPIAAGRVWTGRQALDRKLVDELGGLDAAVRKARSLAGLAETAPAREARAPKRVIPPQAAAGAAGYIGYLLEGVELLSRTPALAVMEYLPGELT